MCPGRSLSCAVCGAIGMGPPGVAEQPRRSWWRSIALLSYVTFHHQLHDRYAGIAHLLMFYGFSVLFIGTCLVFLEHDTPLHFFYGTFYLVASLGIDLGGVAFIVGLVMFLARRLRGSAPRLLPAWWVAAWPGYSWPSG